MFYGDSYMKYNNILSLCPPPPPCSQICYVQFYSRDLFNHTFGYFAVPVCNLQSLPLSCCRHGQMISSCLQTDWNGLPRDTGEGGVGRRIRRLPQGSWECCDRLAMPAVDLGGRCGGGNVILRVFSQTMAMASASTRYATVKRFIKFFPFSKDNIVSRQFQEWSKIHFLEKSFFPSLWL